MNYDLLIKNGEVLDGTGASFFRSDIAIKDGKIAEISKNISGAKKVIDATGLTITPGFIDSHSHSDRSIFDFPDMTEKIEQGITTSMSGQCGSSIAPQNISDGKNRYIKDIGNTADILKTYGSFANTVENFSLGSNNACFVGHASVRRYVMGMNQEKPSDEELDKMKALVADAMEHGAFGLSFGLIYPPSCYAHTEELIELAKVAKKYDRVVSAHIRNESDRLVEATEEFIEVIKKSGARGVLSHHKACGSSKNWGKVVETLKLIDKANDDGAEIYLDVYPYVATHTSASVTFVPDSGRDLINRLKSDEERVKIIEWNKAKWWGNDYSWVKISKCAAYPQYEGLFLPEAAEIHGKDECNTILDMILESDNVCSCCYFTICEQDVENVISHPRAMICTDGGLAGTNTTFHPRVKGSFPRALGRYVREKKSCFSS